MPHADAIQRAFGLHRIDDVSAHVGGKAATACEQIGATAYATGDRIAFAGQPHLHTAAHEAAHVVQQRGGVQLKSNVGDPGDEYERHADRVADAVVSGQSAEALLTQGLSGSASASKAVQKQQAPDSNKPVARGKLSGLRTAAQGYIGDYYSAALAGILAFESDMDSGFDWGAFWFAVGGNLIWASAAFATGGTAFVISVGGIAVSSGAAATSVKSKSDFRGGALKRIADVTQYLNKQVDRVTRSVDADAKEHSWDDSKTRLELLQRMFDRNRPEFVLAGAVPNVNQPQLLRRCPSGC